MEKIRSFIAVEIPGDVQQHLEKIESLLKSADAAPVKWVEPSNIHLTVKFLGDIDPGTVSHISEVISAAVSEIHPFQLEIRGLGVFPNEKRTRIAWAGLAGELETLNRIKQRIDNGLETLGFTGDGNRFNPHITLARVRDRATADEKVRFGKLVMGTSIKPVAFGVDSVYLMKSQLTKTGPIYTRLASFLLK